MGSGSEWSDTELQHLMRAWVYARKDPITGIDQTMSSFNATLFKKFTLFAPTGTAEKTYEERIAKSVRAKFDEIAADVGSKVVCENFHSPWKARTYEL